MGVQGGRGQTGGRRGPTASRGRHGESGRLARLRRASVGPRGLGRGHPRRLAPAVLRAGPDRTVRTGCRGHRQGHPVGTRRSRVPHPPGLPARLQGHLRRRARGTRRRDRPEPRRRQGMAHDVRHPGGRRRHPQGARSRRARRGCGSRRRVRGRAPGSRGRAAGPGRGRRSEAARLGGQDQGFPRGETGSGIRGADPDPQARGARVDAAGDALPVRQDQARIPVGGRRTHGPPGDPRSGLRGTQPLPSSGGRQPVPLLSDGRPAVPDVLARLGGDHGRPSPEPGAC